MRCFRRSIHPGLVLVAGLTVAAPLTLTTLTSPAVASPAPTIAQSISLTTTGVSMTLPSWTPKTTDLVLVAVSTQAWRKLNPTVTGNGESFAKMATLVNLQGIEQLTVFRAQGGSTPGSLSVALPGNSGAAAVIALRVSGVAVGSGGAAAVAATAMNAGPGSRDDANMKVSVPARAGDLLVAFGSNRLRTLATPAGQQAVKVNVAAGSSGGRISQSAWSSLPADDGARLLGANGDLSGADDWAVVGLDLTAGTGDTPSPSPTLTGSPSPSPSPTLTGSPSPSPSPTLTGSPSPSPSPTLTGSPSPSPSPTLTGSPSPSPSPSATAVPGAVRPYSATGPWNTLIGQAPLVSAQSAGLVNAIADNGLPLTSDPDQYTIPVYRFDSSTPLKTVKMSGYFSAYDNGDNSRVGYGYAATINNVPIPTNAVSGAGSDGQIVIWDPVGGTVYAFWQFGRDATGKYVATNGYRYHTTSLYDGRFADGLSGRGAGTPYEAGLVRKWEVDQGHIDHALAFAYNAPSAQYVYPASKSDGLGGGGVDVPEGTRLQLNPSLTDADFERMGLSPSAKIIARALQQYGMYVIDNSGSSKIYLEDRRTAGWDMNITRSMVSAIPWSSFRVVAPPH